MRLLCCITYASSDYCFQLITFVSNRYMESLLFFAHHIIKLCSTFHASPHFQCATVSFTLDEFDKKNALTAKRWNRFFNFFCSSSNSKWLYESVFFFFESVSCHATNSSSKTLEKETFSVQMLRKITAFQPFSFIEKGDRHFSTGLFPLNAIFRCKNDTKTVMRWCDLIWLIY